MSEINRRELRSQLGTRKNRRSGTKSKGVRGAMTRHFHRSRAKTRPSVLLERLIKAAA